jgi:hypothetical protein
MEEIIGDGRYSRSGPNTTNMTRFCDHSTLTTTTPKIKLVLIKT